MEEQYNTTQTKLYLNIQFNKSNFKSIEVSPTTYFKYDVNDVVCFVLDVKHNPYYELKMIIGMLMCAIIIIIGLIELGNYMFS